MKQAGAVERFRREVEAAAKLSHPNIVTAYDADEHQGMHYLAMEYVEGKDLATVVKDHGPLPVRQAVECILQAARGLQYAHEQGIVHRDIKPGNLLLDKKGTVKILDMGLALIAGAEAALGGPERLTATGQVMGTCDYMSPEQALDSHVADHRTDIYALGCTLYRLLTGHPPYRGETLMQILLAHRENQIPSLCEARPEVPAELDACFQRMLAKEPGDRYQSMAEVVAELETVLAVVSGRSVTAAAVSDESPSDVVARTLAFLQEARPLGTPTRQKKPTATERTQPYIGPEHETTSNLLGKLKRAAGIARRKPLLLLGVGGGLVLLLVVVLALSFRQGTLLVEIDEQLGKDVQVAVSQGGEKVQVADAKSGWTLSLDAGKYDLAVNVSGTLRVPSARVPDTSLDARHEFTPNPGADGTRSVPDTFDADNITVTHGGQVKVKVTLKPAPLAVAPFDAKQARKFQDRWAPQLGAPVEITNSIGMKLVLIPPGEFMMGSPKELIEEELKRPDNDQWYKERLPGEGPQHRVRITKPFYLGTYLVTQGEYQRVMGVNPSEFSATGKSKDKVAGQDTKRFPVEHVSWDDAVEFCRRLSEMPEEKAAGRIYRLPSEAQWEHACRAGSTGRFSFSPDGKAMPREYEENALSDYGWFDGNSGGMPHAVGGKRPSAWGLYDMQGNVWEWCQDWYDAAYYVGLPMDDPTGPLGGSFRVLRGGPWGDPARGCRSASRGRIEPGLRHDALGFRVSGVLADK
jgi:formylglycine-generating enzyme required for sulfatase activity